MLIWAEQRISFFGDFLYGVRLDKSEDQRVRKYVKDCFNEESLLGFKKTSIGKLN